MRHPLLSGFSLCLVLAIGGCQASLPPLPAWQSSEGRTHAELGTIVDLSNEQVISPETLVQRLADAPRVLVGEKHDNPDHHALQLWLLRALQGQRTQGSLLLEMLQPSQQSRVDKLVGQVRAGHCGMLPENQLPAMLAVQQQRDRRMAERLQAAPQPALLFAGAYHVRKDLGIPLHLADLGVSGESKVLLLAEVGERVEPGEADYVWYTAAMPEQDYCAQLRR